MPTARLGMTLSKIRNSVEGNKKNRVRIARVPTTSTLRGGCEITSVPPSACQYWILRIMRHYAIA
jgi:hypothetical protein